MAYAWYLAKAAMGGAAGYTAADLWINIYPGIENFDSYWDARINLQNAGATRFTTDGSPCYYNCLPNYTIKKLGAFSWAYPTYWTELGPQLGGFYTDLIAGDIAEIWVWLDSTDLITHYQASCWIIEWDDVYIAPFTFELPVTYPEFAPIWKKQIGEL